MIYGYLRVSTSEQNEARQLDEMTARGIGPKQLYLDKCSGKDFNRPAYKRLIRRLGKGDRLVIKSIDRLGRNYREIIEEWKRIVNEIGADIEVLDMPLLDTSRSRDLIGTLISDIVLQVLSFVAENERKIIRQRQAEGIAAAKQRGVHMGHPFSPVTETFDEAFSLWKAQLMTVTEAAELAEMPRSTFYRRATMYKNADRFIQKKEKMGGEGKNS